MPERAADGTGMRHLRLRWLIALTCLVVLVDIGAAVLTLVATHRTDKSRNAVSAGQSYNTNVSNVMQAVLKAESAERGYLLTGNRSYLTLAATVKQGPGLLKAVANDSRSDPALSGYLKQLATLLEARLSDLEQTLQLAQNGHHAAAVAMVRSNRGGRLTTELETLTGRMVARSNALVEQARSASHSSQVTASRAAIAAYAASGVLLVLMALVLRSYVESEQQRRASRVAQMEAERLSAAKTGFLSRVSHELRTPLNAILGFGQLLEREPLDSGQRETLDQILAGGKHLLAIVDDLLDLSRVETGELRLSIEPVQVAEAIQEARAMMSRAASAGAVGLRNRPIDDSLYIRADRQRLMQILLNLVSNGIKYNRRGGNVVISAERTTTDTVRIEIADTGIGISATDIQQLFTPFERLDAARRGIEGTGLGLAVAKGLAEAMNGKLWLNSEPGVGTTICFELPASSADEIARSRLPTPEECAGKAGETAANANNGNSNGHGTTAVLYIEDNPSNVRLVEKVFALRPELALHVARDGIGGLAAARDLHPALILLDLHLPDISGEQVLAALLADESTAEIPVIIVSADAASMQAKRLRAAGAVGYLTKPFDVDHLLDAVRHGSTPMTAEDHEEAAGALLDPPMVESLHMLAANPAVGPAQIGAMLATFRADSATMLTALRAGLAADDLTIVAREAHRLAGGSGTFGAGTFRHACRDLEDASRRGDATAAHAIDATLDELLERTWEALKHEFAEELRTTGVAL